MKTLGGTLLVVALVISAFFAGAYFGPAVGIGGYAAGDYYYGHMGGYGMMGPGSYGMMGGGWFGLPFMLFGWLFQIGLVALVVLGIVWLVRALGGKSGTTPGTGSVSR